MPYYWPEKRQVIGTSVPRLDGAEKVNGKAKYSFDQNLPGLLRAKFLRSPHAHARIKSLDIGPAERSPGVKATRVVASAGTELHWEGQEIVAVAAETEEQVNDALRKIKIDYEILPALTSEKQSLANAKANEQARGNVDQALKNAAVTVEGFYGAPVITHICLESHGLVAHWKAADELVVYASTQAVHGTARSLRREFQKTQPNVKVTCETPHMGSGYGSKFGPDIQGIVAAHLAKAAKRPVKLMLDRDAEHHAGGNRPSAFAKVKAGASKEGKLLAIDAETYGSGGHSRGGNFPFPYVYDPGARRRRHKNVKLNAGNARAMRAPGHPQGALVMEQVMDDLAAKLGMDPIEFRLKNLPETNNTFRTLKPIYTRELQIGAERIGWKQKYHPPGDKTKGPIKRGLGLSLGTWGGRPGNAQATCTIHPDGKVEVKCGSQDLGTGTTTLVPLVAAEILGLEIAQIDGSIGSSAFPPAGGSGGSTSCGGVSLAVGVSCMKALAKVFAAAAPKLGVAAGELEAEGGKVYVKGNKRKSLSWKAACQLLGQPIQEQADKKEADQGKKPTDRKMATQGVGGAQFADVSVDIETGQVRLIKIVAVADCGLVMNRILCESQVIGGVVMGAAYGLYEERLLDPKTGKQLNPDMEWYKLPAHTDLGDIEVVLLDYPERGTIGIGEPPTIPTAAAIANAVANAIGVRVGTTPITPRKVLEALA